MIPPITDELGAYWQQPPLSDLLVDETHAVMTERTLQALAEYSATIPTGVYPGKMWRRAIYSGKTVTGWLLCWYGSSDWLNCSVQHREILVV